MVISRVMASAVGPVTRLMPILGLPLAGYHPQVPEEGASEPQTKTPATAKTQQPGPEWPSAYFFSASMILLKVSDGRMTAEVFASSGQ